MQDTAQQESSGVKDMNDSRCENGTPGRREGRQVKTKYAKPAFFYKNSSAYTNLEIMLFVSFPLLSILFVASGVVNDPFFGRMIDIFIQILVGFIVSFIFYYLNIAQEKMRIDNESLYLLSKFYVFLENFKHCMNDDIERVSKRASRCKSIKIDPGDVILCIEIITINTHIYNMKNYIESLLFSLQNVLPNSNFILSLFISDLKFELKELDNLKINDKCIINFVQIKYTKYEKLIDKLISRIDEFAASFEDAEMVKQKIRANRDWFEHTYKSKIAKAGTGKHSPRNAE